MSGRRGVEDDETTTCDVKNHAVVRYRVPRERERAASNVNIAVVVHGNPGGGRYENARKLGKWAEGVGGVVGRRFHIDTDDKRDMRITQDPVRERIRSLNSSRCVVSVVK